MSQEPSKGKFDDMTVAQAKAYMGLDEDANDFAIDEKFWQMSKVIRRSKDEDAQEKLDDLSTVYDIATGRRDDRRKAAQIRDKKKKFFGKTGDEWLTFFSYSWFKILIIAVVIIVVFNLLYTIFIKPRPDVNVISVGHFAYEGDFYETFMPELGYKNPYHNAVDIVVPNDEGDRGNAYSEQAAATIFVSEPDLIVTDTHTVKYYFSEFSDISTIYADLREMLTTEQFDCLVPIFCSELEFEQLIYGYEEEELMYEYTEEGFDPSEYDNTPIMIGIEITDDEFMTKLGYTTGWDAGDNLVFSMYGSANDPTKTESIILSLLRLI